MRASKAHTSGAFRDSEVFLHGGVWWESVSLFPWDAPWWRMAGVHQDGRRFGKRLLRKHIANQGPLRGV